MYTCVPFRTVSEIELFHCAVPKLLIRKRYEGADKSLALERKQQATGLKKCIYSTYSPLSSTHF
jgi:hypothetical protein